MEKEKTKSIELIWKEIEETFDWGKVYRAMIAVDWMWRFSDENYGIPSIPTMKKTARKIIEEIYELKSGSVSTGGFTAGIFSGEIYLTFTMESGSTTIA